MKTVNKKFELYRFDELDKEAQHRAIMDRIDFEIEIMSEASLFYNCAVKMEEMKTPWFLSECIYEEHKEDIIGIIDANDCLFLKTGEATGEYLPLDKGKPIEQIYTITTLAETKELYNTRCIGYYFDLDIAIEEVKDNSGDMHEFYYEHCVIEEVKPGLYYYPRKEIWFEWDHEKEGYVMIDEKPELYKNISGFSLG